MLYVEGKGKTLYLLFLYGMEENFMVALLVFLYEMAFFDDLAKRGRRTLPAMGSKAKRRRTAKTFCLSLLSLLSSLPPTHVFLFK